MLFIKQHSPDFKIAKILFLHKLYRKLGSKTLFPWLVGETVKLCSEVRGKTLGNCCQWPSGFGLGQHFPRASPLT